MSQLTTLLFDLDGTLIDPQVGITTSIRYAMAELQRPLSPTTNLDWCIGPPLNDNFAKLLQSHEATLIDKAIAAFRARYATVGLFEADVYDGVVDSLHALQRAGLALFVATSKPAVYAQRIVEHFDLAHFFDHVYGCELDGHLSDKTDLIGHIIAQENLDPAQVMMIGDRRHDVVGAQNNGVRVTAVTYGYGTHEELQRAKADYYIDNPHQIAAIPETDARIKR